jgi:hypothetical protein
MEQKTNKVNNFFTSNNKRSLSNRKKEALKLLRNLDPSSVIRDSESSMELLKNLVDRKKGN